MSRRSTQRIPQSDGMRIIFPLTAFSGKYNIDSFIPSLVDNRISVIEVNTIITKIHEETNFLDVRRLFCMKILFAIICILLIIEFAIIFDPYDYSIPLPAGVYIYPISSVAILIIFIWNIISFKKETKALNKTMVDIIARNQASFQNAGLRWVVEKNLNWLELWMDYRLNQQNYIAPPLYPNNYNANPMMNQYSGL